MPASLLLSYFGTHPHQVKAVEIFCVQHIAGLPLIYGQLLCILLFLLHPCPHSICSGFIVAAVMKHCHKKQHRVEKDYLAYSSRLQVHQ